MLNLGEFSTQPKCCVISRIPISQPRPFALKPPQLHFCSPSNRAIRLGFCSFKWKSRTRFRLHASKNQAKSESESGKFLLDMEDFDGADDFEEDGDGDDDDDDDEVFVPLRNMKEWLQNKPRGFGEGKVYDTSIEDELMEEIEQSRRAQLANINNLKNNPVNQVSMKKQPLQGEVSKDVQVGFRVRLFNLPKKKNILKDLQLAFKGFPGIVNIIPVVSGNSKTRDPVCKGIAFIDLKSEDGAQRFVQTFSGQSIYFGKVQKNIKCEMMSSSSTKLRNAHSDDETSYDPSEPDSDEELEADFEIDAHTSDSWEENDSREYAAEAEHTSAQMDDYDEDMETDSGDEQDNAMEGSATNVSFSTGQKKVVVNEKKKKAKRKKETTPKLNIPGSARRLKIRDKALLTGVLTKYGLNAAEGVKEPS
ncbi:uncharacterized protein LOC116026059 [Ipomoea triloba]|uniref:uncharacterized protein LOC116026059 n=1 Tax=Ipomoea triloba TaxID=35885 RepID=UPI00125E02AA|nr:uncharacterized protein LOC116026059 [Ipomoea triloba]